MNYDLLQVKPEKLTEALTVRGNTRKGYAHVHIPSATSGADEHRYYDLRGLGRHQQKFRNWCKIKFADRAYAVYFGGGM